MVAGMIDQLKLGGFYLRGDLKRLKNYYVRVDRIKKGKVKISHWSSNHWVSDRNWYSKKELMLEEITFINLLDF